MRRYDHLLVLKTVTQDQTSTIRTARFRRRRVHVASSSMSTRTWARRAEASVTLAHANRRDRGASALRTFVCPSSSLPTPRSLPRRRLRPFGDMHRRTLAGMGTSGIRRVARGSLGRARSRHPVRPAAGVRATPATATSRGGDGGVRRASHGSSALCALRAPPAMAAAEPRHVRSIQSVSTSRAVDHVGVAEDLEEEPEVRRHTDQRRRRECGAKSTQARRQSDANAITFREERIEVDRDHVPLSQRRVDPDAGPARRRESLHAARPSGGADAGVLPPYTRAWIACPRTAHVGWHAIAGPADRELGVDDADARDGLRDGMLRLRVARSSRGIGRSR